MRLFATLLACQTLVKLSACSPHGSRPFRHPPTSLFDIRPNTESFPGKGSVFKEQNTPGPKPETSPRQTREPGPQPLREPKTKPKPKLRKLVPIVPKTDPKPAPEPHVVFLNYTKLAEDNLNWFVERLQLFVRDRDFDTLGFEVSAPRLGVQLAQIATLVNQMVPSNTKVRKQYAHAQNMLRVMGDSGVLLNFYRKNHTLAHSLITMVIRLKLRLLAMFNSEGGPGTHLDKYAQHVSELASSLTHWRDMFVSLRNVPLSLQVAFNDQYAQADEALQFLLGFVTAKS